MYLCISGTTKLLLTWQSSKKNSALFAPDWFPFYYIHPVNLRWSDNLLLVLHNYCSWWSLWLFIREGRKSYIGFKPKGLWCCMNLSYSGHFQMFISLQSRNFFYELLGFLSKHTTLKKNIKKQKKKNKPPERAWALIPHVPLIIYRDRRNISITYTFKYQQVVHLLVFAIYLQVLITLQNPSF